MAIEELRRGLRWWTAPHPDWTPELASSEFGWERDVSCFAYEAPDVIVLIDPLVPAGDATFARTLDELVERAARPVEILLTSPWHSRSARELGPRYAAPVRVRGEADQPIPNARTFELAETLPGAVTPFDAHFHGEVLLWIPLHGALVAGDVLTSDDDGVRTAPDPWLPEPERGGAIRESLGFLLDLPVELVLVGHGRPVVESARESLGRALHAPSAA